MRPICGRTRITASEASSSHPMSKAGNGSAGSIGGKVRTCHKGHVTTTVATWQHTSNQLGNVVEAKFLP